MVLMVERLSILFVVVLLDEHWVYLATVEEQVCLSFVQLNIYGLCMEESF
jgi:hypothetical protein